MSLVDRGVDVSVRLAVVGHTNTGKTSVIRSLLRDHAVGEVRDEAATTREVVSYPMLVGGRHVGEIVDTPGLEDAGALLAEARRAEMERGMRPSEALEWLLGEAERGGRRVWGDRDALPLVALAGADAGVLVFDAREPPLDKYWEEYELLSRRGAPLVGLLNCVSGAGAVADAWEAKLRAEGLNAIVRYDAWASDERDAQRLFDKVRELLDGPRASVVGELQRLRRADESAALDRTAWALAEMVVSLAAYRRVVPIDRLEEDGAVRKAFASSWARFTRSVASAWGIETEGIWGMEAELAGLIGESVDGGAAARAGVGGAAGALGGGVVALAAQGLLVDIAAGGLTLGAGAAGGAVIGGALAGHRFVRSMSLRARGMAEQRFSRRALSEALVRGALLGRRVRVFGAASERTIDVNEVGAEGTVLAAALRRATGLAMRVPPGRASVGEELPEVAPDSGRIVRLRRALREVIADERSADEGAG